jgi:hypothetical protein
MSCWAYEHAEGDKCRVCAKIEEDRANAGNYTTVQVISEHRAGFTGRLSLPETTRLARNRNITQVLTGSISSAKKKTAGGVSRADLENMLHKSKRRRVDAPAVSIPLGIARLSRFRAVIDILGKAPWATDK